LEFIFTVLEISYQLFKNFISVLNKMSTTFGRW